MVFLTTLIKAFFYAKFKIIHRFESILLSSISQNVVWDMGFGLFIVSKTIFWHCDSFEAILVLVNLNKITIFTQIV